MALRSGSSCSIEPLFESLTVMPKVPKVSYGLIDRCPRCGGFHNRLKHRKFRKPVEIENSVYIGWAVCPKTKEPMLAYRMPL